MTLWPILLTFLSASVSSFAPLFLKRGTMAWRIPLLALGVALYAIGVGLFVLALRGGELSALYPLLAVTYVLVTSWSALFLGERIDARRMAATALIVAGVVLVGLS